MAVRKKQRPELSPTQERLQAAARNWQGRVVLPAGVRASQNARLNAMVDALYSIGKTTVEKLLNPRRDKNDEYMPSGDILIKFCATADISLDWLVSGIGTMRLSQRKEGASAEGLADFMRTTLVAEAHAELSRAKDAVERIEASQRKAFVEKTCHYVGENALALLVEIAREDVRVLRTFEATFAIEAYARMIRGYSSAVNLRSVAANMDRRAAQLMTTVPKETHLVEFTTDPAGAPRARRR